MEHQQAELLGDLELGKIHQGDCLELMKFLPDKSVDAIICDLPYGVTARNKWDITLDTERLWTEYKRIIKDRGVILLFGQDKFTAKMILSEPNLHRYNLIWDKMLSTGFLNANRMPLRRHEDIMVFYKKLPTYNPQKTKGKPSHSSGKVVGKIQDNSEELPNRNYGNFKILESVSDMKYPTSILQFQKPHSSVSVHPTEKPVSLLEYLVLTFTNEQDIVLDNCMGSGTTALACMSTSRRWIGMELEPSYVELANKRIHDLRLKNEKKE